MGKAKQTRDRVKEMEARLEEEGERGRTEGRHAALKEMIDFLEAKFMDNDVEIDSVRAHAIFAVAGELVEQFRPEILRSAAEALGGTHSRGRDDS